MPADVLEGGVALLDPPPPHAAQASTSESAPASRQVRQTIPRRRPRSPAPTARLASTPNHSEGKGQDRGPDGFCAGGTAAVVFTVTVALAVLGALRVSEVGATEQEPAGMLELQLSDTVWLNPPFGESVMV